MKASVAGASLLSDGQLPRQRGEVETPTSNQSPCIDQRPQAVGARGASHLPFGFASKPSSSAPRARGLLSASWNKGPQTCLLASHSVAQAVAQYGPSSSTQVQDSHDGPSLTGRTTQGFPWGGLARQAREEPERSRQGVPREVLMMQAMTIKTRRAPASAVSSFPFWCKEGKRRREVPRHQAKVSISVQQA